MGWMVAARQAGKTQAIAATATRSSAEASSVSGSRELLPAHDATIRLSTMLSATPTVIPMPSMAAVDVNTSRMMLARCAPSAMRIPTSWVR